MDELTVRRRIGKAFRALAVMAVFALMLAPLFPGRASANDPAQSPSSYSASAIRTQAGDNFSNASRISVNTTVSGSTYSASGGQDDWYKFDLPSAGKLAISMYTSSTNPTGGWWVTLYDSEKNELGNGEYSLGSVATQTMVTTGLPAGTFYVKVSTGYGEGVMKDVRYQLTPAFERSDAWEAEGNNTFGSANSIELNKTAYGTLCSGDPEDWFKVTLASAGRLELSMYSDTTKPTGGWWVTLYDSEKNELEIGEYSFGTLETQTMAATGLPAGTYYIKVMSGYGDSIMQDVIFQLTPIYEQSSSWETESNGTFRTADNMEFGGTIRGTSSGGVGDYDYFRFDVPSSGTFAITLSAETERPVGGWWVALYDSNQDEVASGSYEFGRDASQNVITYEGAKAGTYYIRVHTGYGDSIMQGIAYSLSVAGKAASNIAGASMDKIPDEVYTGSEIKPKPALYYEGKLLREGEDYTLSYASNVNAGTARLTATGQGSYTGTFSATFKISKAPNTLRASGKSATVKHKKLKKRKVVLNRGSVIKVSEATGVVGYSKVSGNRKIKVSSAGKVTVSKGMRRGTYLVGVKVTAYGDGNHLSGTERVTVRIRVR